MATSGKERKTADKTEQRMMSGADIVIETLVREGVSTIFAYPGGCSIPLHQAMTRVRDRLRVVLPRIEQGGGFAAQGYARASGKLGVCMVTSGPGATNLITSIADAKLDSIPLLAITGQVGTQAIGSDGFQETPITEVCRSITKHHYLITDINDIVRVVKEAIYVATTGRQGPVLIDIPKDIQTSQCYPDFNVQRNLPGYNGDVIKPKKEELEQLIEMLQRAQRPVFMAGGGLVSADAAPDFMKVVERTGIPVTTTMPGLSGFPREHELSLGMPGMHGTVCANRALHDADLLVVCGARFSDRVTGKVAEFAKKAQIVHLDVDPSEFNKVKKTNFCIAGDLKASLSMLTKMLKSYKGSDLSGWYTRIAEWKKNFPFTYNRESPYILPEFAIEQLWNAVRNYDVIITTGVGQHQLWSTQYCRIQKPRTWLSSCGFGTMGFGLPAAIGAKIARPEAMVVDIDGDGSFQMNIQEMATCYTEDVPVKVMLLNNQHLGNVVQWEDMFYNRNRANTYLGRVTDPEAFGKGDGISPKDRYPDYQTIARGYRWESLEVSKKEDLPGAIETMLKSSKPFLLEVAVPYSEHVLPMIPPGGTVENTLFE